MQVQGGGSSDQIYGVGETRVGPAQTGRQEAPQIPSDPGKITPVNVMATRAEEKQIRATFQEKTQLPPQQAHRILIGMMALGGLTRPEIQEQSKPVHDQVIDGLKKQSIPT